MPGLAEWFNNMSSNLYRNFIIGLTLSLGFYGCDSGTQWEDSQYEVTWIDTDENRRVYYRLDDGNGIGRVSATVIAVGSDANYLVAKRRDENDQIWFYYIDKHKDVREKYYNGDQITQGPFSEKEFIVLREDLNLPPFQKSFK